ncbi:hypothetical protein BCR41DRAFT_392113 [Lobosporangium transversale]|uniref:Uncharacterized protein n=1 Tax=Lobosporangium transversale TaxID=64571 RepID=A0A1Y2H0X1_9FUNG|nr:hypothetical protein BCR41DRAFT_392113 [Lobosporangium transversale]ORZ27651.1 hypothetical protein BCR41DRAFT_392113 [Lobosporangium transversale]|eukprot:XP_021885354.1 hypothetical protein BCR41DRAFT_392113 [Lobosporangium transversale]
MSLPTPAAFSDDEDLLLALQTADLEGDGLQGSPGHYDDFHVASPSTHVKQAKTEQLVTKRFSLKTHRFLLWSYARTGTRSLLSGDHDTDLLQQMKMGLDTLDCWSCVDPSVPANSRPTSRTQTAANWRIFCDAILAPLSISVSMPSRQGKQQPPTPKCLIHNI